MPDATSFVPAATVPVPAPAAPAAKPAPVPEPEAAKPAPQAAPAAPEAKPGFAERVKAEQAKREVDALRAKLAAAEAKAKQADELAAWRDGLRRDPGALKDVFGEKWYDVLTEAQLSPGRLTAEQVEATVNAKLEEAERKRAEEAQAAEQQRSAAEKAERDAWAAEVVDYVSASNDYRLINLHKQHGAVADFIEDNWRKTGRLMTNAEGAAAFEASLRKAVIDSLDETLVQEWMKSRQPATASGSAREVPKVGALHNGMTSSTPSRPPLTREQRKQAALAKLDQMVGKTG